MTREQELREECSQLISALEELIQEKDQIMSFKQDFVELAKRVFPYDEYIQAYYEFVYACLGMIELLPLQVENFKSILVSKDLNKLEFMGELKIAVHWGQGGQEKHDPTPLLWAKKLSDFLKKINFSEKAEAALKAANNVHSNLVSEVSEPYLYGIALIMESSLHYLSCLTELNKMLNEIR